MLARCVVNMVAQVIIRSWEGCVVSGRANGVDQSLRCDGLRVIDDSCTVGDEIDGRVAYAWLCLQRPLYACLTSGTGHPRHWKRDSLFGCSGRSHPASIN